MADYANRADKEIIVVLAGCIGDEETHKGREKAFGEACA